MIITRTPLRVSLFGGGTDLPEFFLNNNGIILGSAINKYVYHTISDFESKLFDYSMKIAYSKIESVKTIDEINHLPFKTVLKELDIKKDVEVHVMADLPAYTGLGSSSSFTVGLLNAASIFKGKALNKKTLAFDAIKIERERLKEAVGYQDQIFAAFGGFNYIEFKKSGNFTVNKIKMSEERLMELNESLMLFYTGITRSSQKIERKKINNIGSISSHLLEIALTAERAIDILVGGANISGLGKLLDETWSHKKALEKNVSNNKIDEIYSNAISAGALGGKLLGAGGGGFILFFVPKEKKKKVRSALNYLQEISFQLDSPGSSLIFNSDDRNK